MLIKNINKISITLFNILKDNLNEDEIIIYNNNFLEYQKTISTKIDKNITKNIKLFLDDIFRNKNIKNKLKNVKFINNCE